MTPAVADFVTFFEGVYGTTPFAWQVALAERVLGGGGWPEAIDVPTGLGKTAVIDLAVFALAAQAELAPDARGAPTRVFVVVDRRVIVDQAFQRAQHLQSKLEDRAAPGIVGSVADRLRSLSGGRGRPLAVVRMRGGTTWASAWLRSPAQPAVVCGTVDQVGSRLLFRGYGVGAHRRSIDAALVGTDSLLFLDEAHLALPFITTLRSVSEEEGLAFQPVLARRRSTPVLLSATLPLGLAAPTDVLGFDAAAESAPAALDRLAVQRLVRLVDLKEKDDEGLARAVVGLAQRAAKGGAPRTLVVLNTVALARRVFDLLGEGSGGEDPPYERALLIGRCRPAERDLVARQWLLPPTGRLAADAQDTGEGLPVIAVATQTVEVGADLDVDALVTECCPLDALLQRLGRLDRRGSRGTTEAAVVRCVARQGIPLYGEATERTWHWLVEQAGRPTPRTSDKLTKAIDEAPVVDLGPRSIGALLTPAERAALASEPALAPIALGPHFAAWAHTSPAPAPDEDVAPFLHGIERGGATVQVCWRALDSDDPDTWQEELRTAPVSAHELVEVPLAEARGFLAGEVVAGGADLEGGEPESQPERVQSWLQCWLVGPDGTVEKLDGRVRLHPGAIVVVPSKVGGHDEWGWTGRRDEVAVPDVADLGPGHLRRLRLRKEVWESLVPGAGVEIPGLDDDDADLDEVLSALAEAARAGGSRFCHVVAERLSQAKRESVVTVRANDDPEAIAWRLVRLERASLFDSVGEDDPEQTDVVTSAVARPVALEEHVREVEQRADKIAAALGLPVPLQRAVALAALAHDLGKADPRFQVMLYGGSRLRAEASGAVLAKSRMDPADRAALREAWRLSKWPRGMRHEAISASLLDTLYREQPEHFDGVDVDLVRHLVASHHGRSRPLLPPVADPSPEEVAMVWPGLATEVRVKSDELLVDWAAPGRFERLGATYGWWGLALLETVVRLADQAVSRGYATVANVSAETAEEEG